MKIQHKKHHPAKINRLRRAHKTEIEEQERSARSRTNQTDTGRSGDIISLQHNLGNRAVQRLLVESTAGKNIQLEPTPLGANVEMRDPENKARLLAQLLSGEKDIVAYMNGMCYDMAAYILYLRGLVKFEQLKSTNAQNWLPVFEF